VRNSCSAAQVTNSLRASSNMLALFFVYLLMHVFEEYRTVAAFVGLVIVNSLLGWLLMWGTCFLHELAHLLAALHLGMQPNKFCVGTDSRASAHTPPTCHLLGIACYFSLREMCGEVSGSHEGVGPAHLLVVYAAGPLSGLTASLLWCTALFYHPLFDGMWPCALVAIYLHANALLSRLPGTDGHLIRQQLQALRPC
jgi:hypothetical protein